MIVKCHNCDKGYLCDYDQYQGLCPYCETIRVSKLKAGSQYVDKNGTVWIKMEDDIGSHIEDHLFNPKTGRYYHASRVVYRNPK